MGIYIFISILIILSLIWVYRTATDAMKRNVEKNAHIEVSAEMSKLKELMDDWYTNTNGSNEDKVIFYDFHQLCDRFYRYRSKHASEMGLDPKHPHITERKEIIKEIKRKFSKQLKSHLREERLKKLLK